MLKEKTLDLGHGRSLYVRQDGSGPDVVLIHGAMTTSHDWLTSPVFGALGRSHRVSVVDRPGHGLSRRTRFGTPRDQADQIAPLAFPEPRLLEHSILAPRSTPLLGPLFSRFAELTQLDRPMVDLLHHVMFAPSPVPAPWKATYPYALILKAGTMVAEAEDSASMLPMSPAGTIDMRSIKVRTQVLTGTSDRVVEDERQAKRLARELPRGSIMEIEGAGHMLHHSHPELVVDTPRPT
jgi:pimeloyl-ACP methyl ester carboxylesterase